jgi:hypothetical protein
MVAAALAVHKVLKIVRLTRNLVLAHQDKAVEVHLQVMELGAREAVVAQTIALLVTVVMAQVE